MWVSDVELSHAQELVLRYKLAHMIERCLQYRVLWKKTHRVRRRYLASDVHVDVLAHLGRQQREKLGRQHREKLLKFYRVELGSTRWSNVHMRCTRRTTRQIC